MFRIKAGTQISVNSTERSTTAIIPGWKLYTTKEDKLYDKHEVWDVISVINGQIDIPAWAVRNILEFGKVILCRAGRYAMVNRRDIEFID